MFQKFLTRGARLQIQSACQLESGSKQRTGLGGTPRPQVRGRVRRIQKSCEIIKSRNSHSTQLVFRNRNKRKQLERRVGGFACNHDDGLKSIATFIRDESVHPQLHCSHQHVNGTRIQELF